MPGLQTAAQGLMCCPGFGKLSASSLFTRHSGYTGYTAFVFQVSRVSLASSHSALVCPDLNIMLTGWADLWAVFMDSLFLFQPIDWSRALAGSCIVTASGQPDYYGCVPHGLCPLLTTKCARHVKHSINKHPVRGPGIGSSQYSAAGW